MAEDETQAMHERIAALRQSKFFRQSPEAQRFLTQKETELAEEAAAASAAAKYTPAVVQTPTGYTVLPSGTPTAAPVPSIVAPAPAAPSAIEPGIYDQPVQTAGFQLSGTAMLGLAAAGVLLLLVMAPSSPPPRRRRRRH